MPRRSVSSRWWWCVNMEWESGCFGEGSVLRTDHFAKDFWDVSIVQRFGCWEWHKQMARKTIVSVGFRSLELDFCNLLSDLWDRGVEVEVGSFLLKIQKGFTTCQLACQNYRAVCLPCSFVCMVGLVLCDGSHKARYAGLQWTCLKLKQSLQIALWQGVKPRCSKVISPWNITMENTLAIILIILAAWQ